LFNQPALLLRVDYPEHEADSLQTYLAFNVVLRDNNKSGELDPGDRSTLFVASPDGSNLRQVLPEGLQLTHYELVPPGRTLVVQALVDSGAIGDVPSERQAQVSFLYDLATSQLRPYTALDSVAMAAGRLVGRD
jgi:hypothetical protein